MEIVCSNEPRLLLVFRNSNVEVLQNCMEKHVLNVRSSKRLYGWTTSSWTSVLRQSMYFILTLDDPYGQAQSWFYNTPSFIYCNFLILNFALFEKHNRDRQKIHIFLVFNFSLLIYTNFLFAMNFKIIF